jgi:hypothetical protein
VRLHGELGGGLHEAKLERRRRGHELEGGTRRLGRRERDAGERSDLSVARVERRHAAEPAGERHHRRLLETGVDRGSDRLGGPRPRPRENAAPGHQLAAGTTSEALLEGLLEAALPHRPVGGEPARVERPALLGGLVRLHAPGDRVRDAHER